MLSNNDKNELLTLLETRFNNNMKRHPNLIWQEVLKRINENQILNTLYQMEQTGGEPDVTALDGQLVYVDFSQESPKNRRSLCYDRTALDKRKQNKPKSDVLTEAKHLGIILLNEDQYKAIQKIEPMDTKTSSWILTPKVIRDLGGALFCETRYQTIFTFHNGADSYYGSRGFRGYIKI